MIPLFSRTIALAIVAATAVACAPGTTSLANTPTPAFRSQSDVAAIARARADSAQYPYTEADIHFMSGMIGHHAQAIDMARLAPTHGANPSVRTLGARIINAQNDEIATMQQWLRDRLQPVPEARAGPMRMKMNGVEHEMLMPGMLTEVQMQELDRARGVAFDRLFLTYMIQHHQGAVTMVGVLFSTDGAAQNELVFKFASDVNVDQATEIARMELMIAALPSAPAP